MSDFVQHFSKYRSKRFTFNSIATMIRHLSYNVQGILTFGRRSMDYIPNNAHVDEAVETLSILPKDTPPHTHTHPHMRHTHLYCSTGLHEALCK